MTAERPHVVAICGSLREGSYTYRALSHVLSAAERAGGTADLVDLSDVTLPLLDPDADDGGNVTDFRERVAAADTIILGTPMYHGSYSSVLKTALDHLNADEVGEKTVGLLVVAGGAFPLPALEHLRSVCRALGAWVLPHHVAIPNASEAFDGSEFVDQSLADRTALLGQHAATYARIEQAQPEFECSDALAASN